MSNLEKSNRDLVNQNPPTQEGMILEQSKYSAFALSLQGSSHVGNDVPCQDYSTLRYVSGADVLIAAIADGVGSCSLSHWGSYQAVTSAVDFAEQEVLRLSGGGHLKLRINEKNVTQTLNQAFYTAWNSVDNLAVESNMLAGELQSTLTFVLYDGEALYCAHAGDDGVVVQYQDGTVRMLTKRLKGEEASSVYPLQSGENHWGYYAAGIDERGPVVGFVMATDGVLDGFVYEDPEYLNTVDCCNGVFYPFMVRSIYNVEVHKKYEPRNAQETLNWYTALMRGSSYRQRITDDLTFVSVVNPKLIKKAVHPVFSRESWDASTKAIVKRREGIYTGRTESIGNNKRTSVNTDEKEKDEALVVETHEEPTHSRKQIALNIPKKYLWLASGVLAGVALSTVVTLTWLNRPVKSPLPEEVSSSQAASSSASSNGEATQVPDANSASQAQTEELQGNGFAAQQEEPNTDEPIFTCINTGITEGKNNVPVSHQITGTDICISIAEEGLPLTNIQFESTVSQIRELSGQGIQNIKFITQGTRYSFSITEILTDCVGESISVRYDENNQAILTRESTIPGTIEEMRALVTSTAVDSGDGADELETSEQEQQGDT